MKNSKGITVIGLIIAVLILIAIIVVGIQFSKKLLDKKDLEDLKTDMLSIQIKVKTIFEKHQMNEEEVLVGTKLEENNEYTLTPELQKKLEENSLEETSYYIWSQEDINNIGLKEVIVNNKEFYVVDYKTSEVYYSLGYKGTYTLTELNNI